MAIDIIRRTPRQGPTRGEKVSHALRGAIEQASDMYEKHLLTQKMEEENTAIKREFGLDLSGVTNPETRKIAFQLAGQGNLTSAKQLAKSNEQLAKLQANDQIIEDLEMRRGLSKGSLSAYRENPSMAEQITRPEKEPKKTQASQPIDPEQLNILEKVRSRPDFKELDDVEQYRELTRAGVSRENALAESQLTGEKLKREGKAFETAYKGQEDFIQSTTNSHKAFETETKPKLLQMQKLNTDAELINPTGAAFLNALGIPLGALEDPSSELYQKVSLDLLKGLPEVYGNRIMKVEVENFLKTIPTLLNSPEGRRMIASNMLKLGEMKEVYYNAMRREQQKAIESNKFPIDFQQKVLDQVKPQVDKINQEFVNMSEIKYVPPNTVPFFDPNGKIVFVPQENVQWASENGGRRIW